MTEAKISVIIPFRDTVKTLSRSIKSILNQTFKDFELVLINDGSTDGSRELVSEFNDKRIKIIDLPSSGSVAALNEGIYTSKTDIIALLDPFDFAREDRLQVQYDFMMKNDSVDVVTSRVKYTQESPERNMKSYIEWANSIVTNQDIYLKRFINSTILHSTLMFRKKLINSLGEFKYGKFPEDYEILLRWMDNGVTFAKLSDELTEWYDDLQRLSSRHTKYTSPAATKLKIQYFVNWLKGYFRNMPDLLVWGADARSQKRISWFENEKLEISGFVDDDFPETLFDDKPVFKVDELPHGVFIIYFVEQFEPGNIPQKLTLKGLEEGPHYMFLG
jgi:glycosyltransferase involved in cell wall biosynthesis